MSRRMVSGLSLPRSLQCFVLVSQRNPTYCESNNDNETFIDVRYLGFTAGSGLGLGYLELRKAPDI